MLVCVDVDYRDDRVVAAAVGFDAWTDATTALELVISSDAPAAAYEPGQFYLRELPYIERLLALVVPPEVVIVDGYVWLGPDRPGLGARLYDAVERAIPVVGVAKNPFAGAAAIEVLRGGSARPLYMTAVGVDAALAADRVRAMHGEFRVPTLLRRVDQLARGR